MKVIKSDVVWMCVILVALWLAASFVFVCFGYSAQLSILLGLGFWFGMFLVVVIGAIIWLYLLDYRNKKTVEE